MCKSELSSYLREEEVVDTKVLTLSISTYSHLARGYCTQNSEELRKDFCAYKVDSILNVIDYVTLCD